MLPHYPMTAGPSHRGPAHDLVPWMLVLLMHVAHRQLSAHPYVAEHTVTPIAKDVTFLTPTWIRRLGSYQSITAVEWFVPHLNP